MRVVDDFGNTVESLSSDEWLDIKYKLAKLSCLESAGVDNWIGYDYIYEAMKEAYPEEYKWYFGEEE